LYYYNGLKKLATSKRSSLFYLIVTNKDIKRFLLG